MGVRQHIVVIGAGTLGMSAAINLAERGVAVTVIEACSIASGSSGRSIGMVGTQFIDPFQILLRSHSFRQIRAWQELGLAFNAIGYLRLARSDEQMALFHRSVEMQRDVGFVARVIDRDGLQRVVPHLCVEQLSGGLFGPENGFLDPPEMCTLLAGLVRKHGGAVRQRCRLLAAERTAGSGYRLITSTGDLACDGVINAAGAWAPRIAALFGQVLHVRADRHEAVTIHLAEPLAYTMPMVMDHVHGSSLGTGLNVRHDRPGQLITEIHKQTAHASEDPDTYSEQMNDASREYLAELLMERFPALPGAAFGRGWAGLYPTTLDGSPFVGPIDPAEPAIVTAAGAGGYGIQLGPVIGQLAADWIIDGRPASIPEASILAPTPDRNRPALNEQVTTDPAS